MGIPVWQHPVWQEQLRALGDTAAMEAFNERLARSWAVETGILERLYTMDRGITNLLIEQGFDVSLIPHGSTGMQPQDLADMLESHTAALDALFAFVAGALPFGPSFVKELHAVLTRAQETVLAQDQTSRQFNTPLLRGSWKLLPNNPRCADGTMYTYCPPVQVALEMDRLVELQAQLDAAAAEVRAAWLHHRFTQIHPFQDGNGRVARALATLEFLKDGLLPLDIDRDSRGEYIAALEKADAGDLHPLIDLFSKIERGTLLRGMSLAEATLHESASLQ